MALGDGGSRRPGFWPNAILTCRVKFFRASQRTTTSRPRTMKRVIGSGGAALAGDGVRELRHLRVGGLHALELLQDRAGLVEALEVEGQHHNLVVEGLPVSGSPLLRLAEIHERLVEL